MRIPTPAERGVQTGSITVDPLQPVYKNTTFANNQELSQNLSSLGNSLGDIGSQIAAKRDRVAARGAEDAWRAFEREVADPQSGIYTQRGMDANGATDRFTEAANAKRDEIIAQFGDQMGSGSGKAALGELISSRSQALWGKVAGHESSELDIAEQAQLAASIEGAADRASTFWNDDSEFESAIIQTIGAATDMAEGQTEDVINEAVQAETTKVVAARAQRLMEHAPEQVEAFLQAQVDSGRMDQTAADQWLQQNEQNIISSKARVLVDGASVLSVPSYQVADPVRGTPVSSFIDSMIVSESSGRPDASVTIDDGRTFSGLGGVGEARLQDMKNAGVVPAGMTLAEFATAGNADLQRDALEWHFKDIDKAIDASGALTRGYSRDGLRGVAHIGGKGGMRRFINSGGRYNPNDSYTLADGTKTKGTSLSDYYNKFSGASNGGMTVDQRIAQEADPRVREEAFATIDGRRNRQYKADERLSNQVTTQIVTDFETSLRDDTPFDLSEVLAREGVVEALGEKVENVRSYIRRQEAGTDIVTTTQTIQNVEQIIAGDPSHFAEMDLIATFGTELSNQDMKSYLQQQTNMKIDLAKPEKPTEVDEWTRAAANTLVVDVAAALKIEGKPEQARLLGQALQVSRLYAANNNGAKMGDAALSAAVRELASNTKVANFDPAGLFGDDDQKKDASFQDVLKAADKQDISEFMSGEVDLTLTYNTLNGDIDHVVTPLEFQSAYRYIYQINKSPPTPSQVITALQLYPPEDIEDQF